MPPAILPKNRVTHEPEKHSQLNVLIVESAAKARTLQKYLGEGWRVLATGGHIETLPHDRERHGRAARKAYWAHRAGELPKPPWVWTERGEQAVRAILEAAGDEPVFWLATDPDREGEFIAWRLQEQLREHGSTRRVAFDEVTETGLRAALEAPRPVDREMVRSALVRKFLDRLVGYRTSRTANTILPGRGASMGRVQTPTLGFVVERELEREAHTPIRYFEVRAAAGGVDLSVRFHEPDDPDAWRNQAGKVDAKRTFDGGMARSACQALDAVREVTVTGTTSRRRQRAPDSPMSTDVLLQVAGSRLGWSLKKTAALASMLYEAGDITYIRTDSTRLAASAVAAAREVVKQQYGEDHLGPGAGHAGGSGRVQDAHEAIRPTRLDVAESSVEDDDGRRLYRLIRASVLASQMAPSQRNVVSVEAACDGLDRPLTGSASWRTFAGWEAAYAEFMGDMATAPPDVALDEGAVWTLDPRTEDESNPILIEDETKPPPRYRPHTLIKAMKEAGIGRPSTYSRTVERLEERGYVEEEQGSLLPTQQGRVVWLDAAPLYAAGGDGPAAGGGAVDLFSPEYTAWMENQLDRIERGEVRAPEAWQEWRDRIRELHELARERLRAGAVLPRQIQMLERLLDNAPDGIRAELRPRVDELSHDEAAELIEHLRARGIAPAASKAQLDYVRQLQEDLSLSSDEMEELTGVRSPEEIRNSSDAHSVIDELRRIHDERRPATANQRRFIDALLEQVGLTEHEAAALVGAGSLQGLTGGEDGTASMLIGRLQELAG